MFRMTRESINKQSRAWAGRDWVRLEHGAIVVLNAEMLRELAEAGSGSEGEFQLEVGRSAAPSSGNAPHEVGRRSPERQGYRGLAPRSIVNSTSISRANDSCPTATSAR